MKLTSREAQRIVVGLRKIDSDNETKLVAEVRLRLGVNINRLMPYVQLFEKEISRIQLQMTNGAENNPVKMRELAEELEKAAEATEDFRLKKFNITDFELSKNPKIKADVLYQIAPLIKDFDDGESDE